MNKNLSFVLIVGIMAAAGIVGSFFINDFLNPEGQVLNDSYYDTFHNPPDNLLTNLDVVEIAGTREGALGSINEEDDITLDLKRTSGYIGTQKVIYDFKYIPGDAGGNRWDYYDVFLYAQIEIDDPTGLGIENAELLCYTPSGTGPSYGFAPIGEEILVCRKNVKSAHI